MSVNASVLHFETHLMPLYILDSLAIRETKLKMQLFFVLSTVHRTQGA